MNPFLLVLLGRMGPDGAAVGDFIARLTQSGDRRITQSGIARAVQSSGDVLSSETLAYSAETVAYASENVEY